MSRFPLISRWTVAATLFLVLAGGTLWGRHVWKLSEFPGLCNAAANLENWSELEVHARAWTQANPGEAIAWYRLGEALQGQKQYEEAFDAFRHVPLRGPRGIDAATARLEIQFHVLHLPMEALRIADQILSIEPEHADARRNRIYFDAMTMQRSQLTQEIHRVIETGGDLPDHYLYLLNLEDLWFMDGPELVEQWALKSPDSVFLKASQLVQAAKRARAATFTAPGLQADTTYQEILAEIDSQGDEFHKVPSVLEFQILLAAEKGQLEEVGRLLALVPDEAANDPLFWKYRGWYAIQTGNPDEADRCYLEAIRLHPLSSLARHEYAQFLRTRGRTDEAGQVQSLASRGTALVQETRRLIHLKDAPSKLLQEISRLAGDCREWQVSNGIHRHQNPNLP